MFKKAFKNQIKNIDKTSDFEVLSIPMQTTVSGGCEQLHHCGIFNGDCAVLQRCSLYNREQQQ